MGNTNLTARVREGPGNVVFFAFLALVFVASPRPAFAQSSSLSYPFTKSQTADGFRYMTGGFGIDDREQMTEQSRDYNLKLMFAEKAGIYLADARVAIENEKGEEIVNITAPGPWFYIQLPPGTYNVTASFEGNTKTIRNIPVSKSQQTSRLFHWDVAGEPEHPELLSQLKSEKQG